METGLAKDNKTGEKIPAHFIQEVVCTHNGNNVMTANWGAAISKNPYLSFSFNGGAAGDTVETQLGRQQGRERTPTRPKSSNNARTPLFEL